MDVVALAQYGVSYAVASLGTATTEEQLQTLFRTVQEVICCYDGDRAGRDAAWRAMNNALPLIRDGYTMKFVFLPDGEDPDSLIREQGQGAFEKILDEATPLSKFIFNHLIAEVDMSSLEGRASLVNSFQPYLARLPAGVLKDGIINELANNFGTGTENQLAKFKKNNADKPEKYKPQAKNKVTPIRLAIALLLEHPHIVNALPNASSLQHINLPGIVLFNQLVTLCKQNPTIKSAQVLEKYRDTAEGQQLAKLMCWQHHVEAEAAEDVFLDCIEKMFNSFVEQRTELLLQKAQLGQMSQQEKQELQALLNA